MQNSQSGKLHRVSYCCQSGPSSLRGRSSVRAVKYRYGAKRLSRQIFLGSIKSWPSQPANCQQKSHTAEFFNRERLYGRTPTGPISLRFLFVFPSFVEAKARWFSSLPSACLLVRGSAIGLVTRFSIGLPIPAVFERAAKTVLVG